MVKTGPGVVSGAVCFYVGSGGMASGEWDRMRREESICSRWGINFLFIISDIFLSSVLPLGNKYPPIIELTQPVILKLYIFDVQILSVKLIESERFYVRYYTMEDEVNFCRLNRDEEVMRYIRPVKSQDDTIAFFKEIIGKYKSERPDLRLALLEKTSNQFVGSFAIIPVEKTPDTQIGYSFLKEHWGKGYATEITKAGVDYVFNVLQLPEVFGVAESANIASQKVLMKNGFTLHRMYREGEKEMYVYVLKK